MGGYDYPAGPDQESKANEQNARSREEKGKGASEGKCRGRMAGREGSKPIRKIKKGEIKKIEAI